MVLILQPLTVLRELHLKRMSSEVTVWWEMPEDDQRSQRSSLFLFQHITLGQVWPLVKYPTGHSGDLYSFTTKLDANKWTTSVRWMISVTEQSSPLPAAKNSQRDSKISATFPMKNEPKINIKKESPAFQTQNTLTASLIRSIYRQGPRWRRNCTLSTSKSTLA